MEIILLFKFENLQPQKPAPVFYEIAVLKHFSIFTGKHMCWSLFLIKLKSWRPATLLKEDSNTLVFQWILQNFQGHLFWRTFANGCFCTQVACHKIPTNKTRYSLQQDQSLMLSHSMDLQVQKYIVISKKGHTSRSKMSILQTFCCKRIMYSVIME